MRMQLGSCGCCDKIQFVTIKALDKADGTTVWEYGPGSWWRHHYGADAISGIVGDVGATLNKYVISAAFGNVYSNAGNRNAGTLDANAMECLSFVKLDSLDGTTIESATIEGLFCSAVSAGSFSLFDGLSIVETAALSGGDFVIAGPRVAAIEFEDFTANAATKDYILHAHNHQRGNIYVKTRTSSEEITIPYDASAATVASLFAATTDCTSASATGGPWPHSKINLACTWSVAGGDIAAIKTDVTATGSTPGTGTCFYEWDGTTWVLLNDSCTTGTPTPPSFNGTTIGEGAPGACRIPGTGSQSVYGAATTYSTSTGLILNSVGRIFGASTSITATKLIALGTAVPTVTANANETIFTMVAGPSDTLAIGGSSNLYAESWTVDDPWTNNWQKFLNAPSTTIGGPRNGIVATSWKIEAAKLMLNFANTNYGGTFKASAYVDMTTGTVTELANSAFSTSSANGDNRGATLLHENDPSTKTECNFSVTATVGALRFRFHFEGMDTYSNTTRMLLGSLAVASVDGSNVYGTSGSSSLPFINYRPPTTTTGTAVPGANARQYTWTFYIETSQRFTAPTQFRFVFRGGTTSWLDWDATAAEIKTAILGVYPENTGGVVSNAVVYPFGEPTAIINTDASFIERNLTIVFAGFSNPTGRAQGYITPSHVSSPGRVVIETRTATSVNTPGITAWSRTDASVVWTRPWGTNGGGTITITYPTLMWSKGDFVYAYGQQVENDL